MIPGMTTPDTPMKPPEPVTVHGRDIEVRWLQDAQYLLLAREARLAQREETDKDRRFVAISRIFDILESAVVLEADREYLVDLTVQGKLSLGDLTGFITPPEKGDSDASTKPKVRRGTTKRA